MAGIFNVFESFIQEDIDICVSDDFSGGLQPCKIFYCYLPYIRSLKLPGASGYNETAGRILQNIICEENRGFSKLEALIDTSDLHSEYDDSGMGSDQSEIQIFIPGTRAALIGLSRKLRHRPFVFLVETQDGRRFVLGTLVSPAYLTQFSLQTGRQYEDDNGAEIRLRANTIIYEYAGEIPMIPPDDQIVTPGDFSSDFDKDFD